MNNKNIKNIIFPLALILILVGAVAHSFIPLIAPYVMLAGVASYAAITFTTPYPGKSLRGKRLFNIQILAILLMIASTYLMFAQKSIWVLLMLVAAVLTLYCSSILPKVLEKEKKDNAN